MSEVMDCCVAPLDGECRCFQQLGDPAFWEMPSQQCAYLKPELPAFWTVAIYLDDRAFGGPEEGGWWFDCGQLVTSVPEGVNVHDLCTMFKPEDEKEAISWMVTLQTLLDAGPNKDGSNRDLGSVNCVGRYVAHVHAGWPPKHHPEVRPHYE